VRWDEEWLAAGADRHQEWLAEHTGRLAALDDGTTVPETNFMDRAAVGETTGGYVKTSPLAWSRL
jgi:hypothetical protein